MGELKKDVPVLKIGIVSDSQCYDVREDWGMSNLADALKLLAEKKPEMLIMPGDLADLGDYPGRSHSTGSCAGNISPIKKFCI